MVARDDKTDVLPAAAGHVAPAGSLIGRTLGKLTIVEGLGRGGSGEVFRAEQSQLGRSAVIKVLRRDTEIAPNRVERFLREAKLASRLDHPYAAHVYAFGAESDGILWIAMEYVRGVTLDELVAARGAIPTAVFAPLFARLCEVVHTAHELGIVHRDIKGSNVMVIERAGQLLPKLLDFGIAKGIDGNVSPSSDGEDDNALTSVGSTLGSPHYMAPEQWRSPGDVDARADIYALGVLAYRCVAGHLPFKGIERPGLPGAHQTMPPPALPDTVPIAIAEAIMRALAKQPDARWPSALLFGKAIGGGIDARVSETVPIFDPATRDAWLRNGPQPIADAVARLARAATTVEADAALRELVAITCRWLAVLALSQLHADGTYPEVRKAAHAVVGRDDAMPWLRLARIAAKTAPALPGLEEAVAGTTVLEQLATHLDDRDRARTAAALAADIAAVPDALQPLDSLLGYQLVVGRAGGAESWQGVRRRDRDRVVVWGEPLADGEVALLDGARRVVTRLSPLAQVVSPLPSAEPELFLLWRSARGVARLVAAPWGFERDDDAAAKRLAVLTTEDSDTVAEAAADKSPYPGLAPYRADDADRFVGREREVEALANRLIRAPMVAVLGPSGAGKSSFIHAGLLPRLAENYEIITMRPGRHPLHALAALPPINLGTEDEAGIAERLRTLGDRAPRGLVVVVDQLEELVTLCGDPVERDRFARTLAAAAHDRSAPVRIVVTLRDDFATVIESEDAFRGRFEVFVLATPPPEALRRIVTEPARRAGVSVDPEVVEDMVAEVAGRPASLPLLSFTGSQLWLVRDRASRRITHESYVALGGVAGALSTYADEIYQSLARRDQEVVRDLFSRLVASDGTRIPAPRRELEELPGAKGVLAHLIDARLLVVREDDGIDVVEIIHECLATRWDRLARWRSEDAADRALLRDVGTAARRWDEAGRRPDQLWRGEALADLRKLAARSAALTDLERTFAGDSERAALRARRTRRAFVVLAMTVLAATAVVMGYLRVLANQNQSAAERSAGEARTAAQLAEERLTAGLIAHGRRELNDGRALAALAYFGEAMRRGAAGPGLRFMLGVGERAWRDELLVVQGAGFKAATGSPTGIAAGDRRGHLHFWTRDLKPAGELATEAGEIFELDWVGDRVLVVGRSGVAVIDAAARKRLGGIAAKFPVDAYFGPAADELVVVLPTSIDVYGIDGVRRRTTELDLAQSFGIPYITRDAKHVFITIGSTITVVDLVTMQRRVVATDVAGQPGGSWDGTTVVYLDKQRRAHVLAGDGTPVTTFQPTTHAEYVELSASGDRIGLASKHALAVHDRTGKLLRTIVLEADEHMIRLRGDDVWTGSMHGVIRHYHEDTLVASLPSHGAELEWLRLSDELFLTISNDYSLVVLRADARQLVTDRAPCKDPSMTFSGPAFGFVCPDGSNHIYIGRRKLGVIRAEEPPLGWAAIEPSSQRAVVAAKQLSVFEPDGKLLVASGAHLGAADFEDRDHIVVADDGTEGTERGLWRWTYATDRWERLADVDDRTSSIVVTPGGILMGGQNRSVVSIRDGKEQFKRDLGERIDALTLSADGRFVAAQLGGGGTVILDGDGQIVRRFEPADSFGVAAMLDAKGDLVLRTGRGTMTVWDRNTGDNLIYKLDLLRSAYSARFDDKGRIELAGQAVGLLDIAPDTRPVAEILRAIDCRVPLRVAGSRLEARTIECR